MRNTSLGVGRLLAQSLGYRVSPAARTAAECGKRAMGSFAAAGGSQSDSSPVVQSSEEFFMNNITLQQLSQVHPELKEFVAKSHRDSLAQRVQRVLDDVAMREQLERLDACQLSSLQRLPEHEVDSICTDCQLGNFSSRDSQLHQIHQLVLHSQALMHKPDLAAQGTNGRAKNDEDVNPSLDALFEAELRLRLERERARARGGAASSAQKRPADAAGRMGVNDPWAPLPGVEEARCSVGNQVARMLRRMGYVNKDPTLLSSVKLLRLEYLAEILEDCGLTAFGKRDQLAEWVHSLIQDPKAIAARKAAEVPPGLRAASKALSRSQPQTKHTRSDASTNDRTSENGPLSDVINNGRLSESRISENGACANVGANVGIAGTGHPSDIDERGRNLEVRPALGTDNYGGFSEVLVQSTLSSVPLDGVPVDGVPAASSFQVANSVHSQEGSSAARSGTAAESEGQSEVQAADSAYAARNEPAVGSIHSTSNGPDLVRDLDADATVQSQPGKSDSTPASMLHRLRVLDLNTADVSLTSVATGVASSSDMAPTSVSAMKSQTIAIASTAASEAGVAASCQGAPAPRMTAPEVLNATPAAFGLHDSAGQHFESAGQHAESANRRAESAGQYAGSAGRHAESAGLHAKSAGQYVEPANQHAEAVNQHTESVSRHHESVLPHAQAAVSVPRHADPAFQHAASAPQHAESAPEPSKSLGDRPRSVPDHSESASQPAVGTASQHAESATQMTKTLMHHANLHAHHLENDVESQQTGYRREVVLLRQRQRQAIHHLVEDPDLISSWLVKAKAQDVCCIDIRKQAGYADWMVIATGLSQQHVAACVQAVKHQVATRLNELGDTVSGLGFHVPDVVGPPVSDWVAVHVGSCVVHVFTERARQFYDLETLWGTERTIRWFKPDGPVTLTLDTITAPALPGVRRVGRGDSVLRGGLLGPADDDGLEVQVRPAVVPGGRRRVAPLPRSKA